MLLEPTDEYTIRRGVVKKLLKEGWDRKNIRIEIPMSTASYGGRADIVCLSESYIGSVELKSGKDKLENKAVKEQLEQYERTFDFCALVADALLHKKTVTTTVRSTRTDDNFNHVDVVYRRSYRGRACFSSPYDLKAETPYEKITPHLFPLRRPGRRISVYDMAQTLWADELREALNSKGTKSHLEIVARDNFGVKEFRPILINALRNRPLNDWENTFWSRFDKEEKENA